MTQVIRLDLLQPPVQTGTQTEDHQPAVADRGIQADEVVTTTTTVTTTVTAVTTEPTLPNSPSMKNATENATEPKSENPGKVTQAPVGETSSARDIKAVDR